MSPISPDRLLPFTAPLLLMLWAFAFVRPGDAQIPRTRANVDGPVDEVFWTPAIVTQASVANLPAGNLNLTIMHAFGRIDRGVENLFGLDDSANIRFGIDYGITDRLSIGLGRSRFEKVYDARIKLNLLRQTRDGRIPLEMAVMGDAAVTTLENGFELSDRMSFLGSMMFARKVSNRLSIQVAPTIAHFNTVSIRTGTDGETLGEENTHLVLGFGVRIGMGRRTALLVDYLPVLGRRSDRTVDEIAVAVNIETGGHVFQLFLKTSQWLTGQHAVARNTDDLLAGDVRFGFNVNRVFALGAD